MTPAPPARTNAERMAALEYANQVRSYRKEVKRALGTGERTFGSLREDPLMATAKMERYLRCVPKVGDVTAAGLMRRAGLRSSLTFERCTDRQWQVLQDTAMDYRRAGALFAPPLFREPAA